jgi:hypothetical protein
MLPRHRSLWVLGALLVSATPARAAPAGSDASMATCTRQLTAIGRAFAAYQRDKGRLPANLSDLYPRYVKSKALLHCPADPTPGSLGYERMKRDPKLPVSYMYELSLQGDPAGVMLGPDPPGGAATWRNLKLAQRVNFGDRVPVARCWHHAMRSPHWESDWTRVVVLTLTPTGQVYRSAPHWELDPATVRTVLERLKHDLAATARADGTGALRRRWEPARMVGYFRTVPSVPALQERYRAVADKLAGLTHTGESSADTSLILAAGCLYRAAGDTAKAIQTIEAVALEPAGREAAVYLLADLYRTTGQHERQIALLERQLEQQPANTQLMQMLAAAYQAAGQPDKAAEWRRKADPGEQLVGQVAPGFALKDLSGKEVRLGDLKGKVAFLNFWASW